MGMMVSMWMTKTKKFKMWTSEGHCEVYPFTKREIKQKMFLSVLIHRVLCPSQLLRRGSSRDEMSPLCTSSVLQQEVSCNTERASVEFWHLCYCKISSYRNSDTSAEAVNAKCLQMGRVWDKQQRKDAISFINSISIVGVHWRGTST